MGGGDEKGGEKKDGQETGNGKGDGKVPGKGGPIVKTALGSYLAIPSEIMKRINARRNEFQCKTPSTFISIGRAPTSFDTAMNILFVVGKGYITDEKDEIEKWRKELADEYREKIRTQVDELTKTHELIMEENGTLEPDQKQEILNSIEKDRNYLVFVLTLADAVRENLSGLKKKSSKDVEFEMKTRDGRVEYLNSQKNFFSVTKLATFLGVSAPALIATLDNFVKAVQETTNKMAGSYHAVLAAVIPLAGAAIAVLASMAWDNRIENKKNETQTYAEKRREEIDVAKIEETRKILAISELRLIGRAAYFGYIEDLREIAPLEFVKLVEENRYEDICLIIDEATNIIETGQLFAVNIDKEQERLIYELAARVGKHSLSVHKICSERLAKYTEEESRRTATEG